MGRVLQIALRSSQSLVGVLLHLERRTQLARVLLGLEPAVAFSLGFRSFCRLRLLDRVLYLIDALPVREIRDGQRDKRDANRDRIAKTDDLKDKTGNPRA